MIRLHQIFFPGMALAVILLTVCPLPAARQDSGEDRTPGGDLSAFFNPPGIAKKTTTRTTRKIGSKKTTAGKKNTPATAPTKSSDKATNPPPAMPAKKDAPPKKSEPSKSTTKKDNSKDQTAGGRLQMPSGPTDETTEGGIALGPASATNWRVGVVMVTGTKPVTKVTCRIPVPTNWPEQKVEVVKEELPPEISRVKWEEVGNIKILELKIEEFPARERLIGLVTFRVETKQIIAPKDTSIFRMPKKRLKATRSYLGESPEISFRDTKVKKLAKSIFDVEQSDWVKIEGLYDWVRDNIEERAIKSQGSVATFRNKFGSSEDRCGLFIALCRANKVPARMVFYDGGQYAEFFLVDNKEQGHWFPCKISGIREFGEIGEPKVILQKGDNYRVPGEKKKLKFVPAKAEMQGSKPRQLKFAREPLPADE